MNTTLDKVKEGQKCLIIKLNVENSAMKRRFADLGLVKGNVITVVKKQRERSGLIIVTCFNSKLMFRKRDIKNVEVQILECQKIDNEQEIVK